MDTGQIGGVVGLDATDGTHRPRTDLDDLGKTPQPQVVGLGFRPRGMQCPHAQIVDDVLTSSDGCPDMFGALGRQSEQAVGADDAPRRGNVGVGLADVGTGCPDGLDEVHPVINQQWDSCAGEHIHQTPPQDDEVVITEVVVPQLDQSRSPIHGLPYRLDDAVRATTLIGVGDQVHRQVDVRPGHSGFLPARQPRRE